jgi:pimeloyl-ACP methyl ester carboxylesterase
MTLPEMAADIVETATALGLQAPAMMGHSLGGQVAMQLALANPKALTCLIVADIAPKEYAPHHRQILDALLSVDAGAAETRAQIEEALGQAIPELAVRRFLLKNLIHRPAGGFGWRIPLKTISDSYEKMSQGAWNSGMSFPKPALFIKGGASDYILADDEAKIKAVFPQATIRTLGGAGHWLHAEQPGKFSGLVLEFLKVSFAASKDF